MGKFQNTKERKEEQQDGAEEEAGRRRAAPAPQNLNRYPWTFQTKLKIRQAGIRKTLLIQETIVGSSRNLCGTI